ncbi:MAG: GWxTD domain-containing protein [Bacteroidia bacterium]
MLCLWSSALLWSQVNFYFEPLRFETPDRESYYEFWLGLDGTSLRYKAFPEGFRGEAQVTWLLKNIDGQVLHADKLVWQTPFLPDTTRANRQVFLHKKRLRLKPENYEVEIEMQDPYATPSPKVKAVHKFFCAPAETIGFSDVMLVQSFQKVDQEDFYTRHGMRILPWVGGFLLDADTLHFFGEVYGLDTVPVYYLALQLYNAETNEALAGYRRYSRPRKGTRVGTYLFSMPALTLPSGNYLAIFSIHLNDGTALQKWYRKFTLLRSNEAVVEGSVELYDQLYGYAEKELDEYLDALTLIASPAERNMIHVLTTRDEKKRFFVGFWEKRQKGGTFVGPSTWEEYLNRIRYASKHFKSTLRPGWKTDRGRVFLQYGPPNDRQMLYNEPDKYPYEIWTYNRLGAQQNVIFVFYDPDLITGEFPLLHSNKLGELQNRNWRAFVLRARAASTGETEPFSRIGGGATGVFRDDQAIGVGQRDDR